LSLSYHPLQAQSGLKSVLERKLRTIVDTTDAVVGVAIVDLKTGERFSLNGDEVFPLASTIKIPILAELFRQSSASKVVLDEPVKLEKRHQVGGGQILQYMTPGSTVLTLRDYAHFMIIQSDNSATNLLIEKLGMNNINDLLRSAGLQKTRLQRVMMDITAAKEGRENIGTPDELAELLKMIHEGKMVSTGASHQMAAILTIEKDGPLRSAIPWKVKVANKEGELEGARSDCAIVYLEGNPYIVSVQVKYLKNPGEGTAVIRAISDLTYQYFERLSASNEYGRRL